MKKNEKIKYPLPVFEVIADAIVGDVTALQRLLKSRHRIKCDGFVHKSLFTY